MIYLISIVLYFYLCHLWANIAERKGYDYWSYWLKCFLFGFIGWLLVIAEPDKK